MKIIEQVIKQHNLSIDEYDLYGSEIAKIKKAKTYNPNTKLIVITAMNPTPAGEGKTTTSIGLVDALNKHGLKTVGALREPSLGPVFGMKGTGSGGGLSYLQPFDKINLHFSGDLHAIACANNLIVAVIENEIYFNSKLNINPEKIFIKRCLDINDRCLREINYQIKNHHIKTGFNITAASDLMALFCLCNDHDDFKNRIAKMIVALDYDNNPITIEQLEITDAIMTILDDALYPNLVRTKEDNPVLVHGGPFANIAHGCNSVIATKTAMGLADCVVTECGFGSDLGLEKFMNIKAASFDLEVDLIGIVISLRSIKYHANADNPNEADQIKLGFSNSLRHFEHLKQYQIPFIAYINVHSQDSEEELVYLESLLDQYQINHARSYAYSYGSSKSEEIATKTKQLLTTNKFKFKPIYDLEDDILTKINKVIKKVYLADSYELSALAKEQLANLKTDQMYLCMAKTPYSLSADPNLLNAPVNFTIKIESFEVNYAANMIIAITTTIYRIPGLNKVPAAKNFVMK
ncbi:formate--tetrahydrofolate ligase [Ureaplasma diversum]|uniref:Formate--tetrahydrofolate ligase n=1 Tax=Ureaplasma diversum TaxID=42094 RepID=A0A0C5RPX1_9BACT|nr:formate--tetrahydrofolate ligase [Ureaplasma diversum]AJQ45419.1 formate--tetrahydrofolate ligase [Ureaplasma diversum]